MPGCAVSYMSKHQRSRLIAWAVGALLIVPTRHPIGHLHTVLL